MPEKEGQIPASVLNIGMVIISGVSSVLLSICAYTWVRTSDLVQANTIAVTRLTENISSLTDKVSSYQSELREANNKLVILIDSNRKEIYELKSRVYILEKQANEKNH